MDNHAHQAWVINLTGIDKGIFRTMNGNADELIAIGRVIKAGFPCSRVDVTNAKYDAIVDLGGKQKLLRIQIKGTGGDTLNFTGAIGVGFKLIGMPLNAFTNTPKKIAI
ncbi:hypothetical protein [Helicobacter pylori]|uniref:hypothetical protein n=1 Tax=Helicobacter pylori TaxID=210 RepID=UPI001E3745FA|nr:hypothetical protein [Helicobacter pylori]